MGLIDKAETWLLSVAVKRVAAGLAGLVAGYLASAPAQALLAKSGVSIDPTKAKEFIVGTVLTAAIAFHDWARLQTWGKKL